MKKVLFAAAIALGAFIAAPASAAPVITCSTGIGNGGSSAIDLITDGCISQAGDGFYGSSGGGDSQARVEQAIFHATGVAVDLSLYGASDEDPELFTFNPADPETVTSGLWTVNDPNVRIKYVTIKAADGYVLFEFAGVGVNSASFSTLGLLNGGGQQPDVSHLRFWNATVVDPNTPDAVPEPATWAMMLGGFGLLGSAMRRRAKTTVTYA